jgi:hypothetical protein
VLAVQWLDGATMIGTLVTRVIKQAFGGAEFNFLKAASARRKGCPIND